VTHVYAGGRCFDVDLVVLDKDGTLFDFERLWAGRAEAAVAALLGALSESQVAPGLEERLYRGLGYERVGSRTRPDSPLATAPLGTLAVLVAGMLYQGTALGWHRAERLAKEHFLRALKAPVAAEHIVPIGDLPALLGAWTRAGLRLAIATSDDRAGTEDTLRRLGLAGSFHALACGDDPLPAKPDPAVLRHLGTTLSVPPERMLMVGDSVHDLATGRSAGVAGCIGVLSGTADRDALAPLADVVVESVQALRVAD
jgi:phosphoglycolate phosphatase